MLQNWIADSNFQKILDTVGDGIVVIGMDRKIRFINETARKLLKFEPGEAVGKRCKTVTRTSECEGDCPLTRAIKQDRDLDCVSMWYQSKDDQLYNCMTSVALLRDEQGEVQGGVEVFRDISEIDRLQKAAEERFSFEQIIGASPAMGEVYDQIEMVAETDSTTLILGESGTGKELVANAVHYRSLRRNRPFVKINCAALNVGVLESELFGHVRGAFTGAVGDKKGRFEMADGGTIFLDEIGEVPPSIQVKLLRVLQEGELERVGSSKLLKVDVRLIVATHRDLPAAIETGEFRQDLYYRLNVFQISIPPLRDRREDIPLLVDHMIRKVRSKMPGKPLKGIHPEAMNRLLEYDFPGNVRELENLVEHAAIRCTKGQIRSRDLPLPTRLPQQVTEELRSSDGKLYQIRTPLEEAEREMVVRTLEDNSWKISKTAQKLGISRVTLWRKMKEYGVQKP